MPGNQDDTAPTQPAEEKPVWHPTFFRRSLIVSGIVAAVVLAVFGLVFGLGNDWKAMTASARLAATLAVPITVLGVLLICAGAALAGTEWRGTLKEPTEVRGAGEEGAKVIEAVAKLRGPALLIVSGALLLGGSAWIASSAAKAPVPDKPSESTSSTASPGGTAT